MISQKIIVEKTISWRIVASLTTFTIAWIVTGELSTGLTVGGIEFFAKMILYYFHELAWEKIKSR
ncbi:TPA: DUF2061 domain-containing protein [Candidatus Saccharibacteria bacterium]|nr:DUF2061 domain-containing protein [Candidatus Saccharibacteria bacterium]HIO87863.1 DUF2061 domain-containing protein [Candidatus Saccharibacteria bacterium]